MDFQNRTGTSNLDFYNHADDVTALFFVGFSSSSSSFSSEAGGEKSSNLIPEAE